jgi:hypothetical protein
MNTSRNTDEAGLANVGGEVLYLRDKGAEVVNRAISAFILGFQVKSVGKCASGTWNRLSRTFNAEVAFWAILLVSI